MSSMLIYKQQIIMYKSEGFLVFTSDINLSIKVYYMFSISSFICYN